MFAKSIGGWSFNLINIDSSLSWETDNTEKHCLALYVYLFFLPSPFYK